MSTPLFSFGLITDTHIRPPQGDNSSPFPVNDRANNRARYAARLLALQAPLFSIHMGDMVHTLPHMPLYDDACAEALEILSPLQPDLYFMAGNHDIGDKPMPASPAAGVNEDSSARYRKHFGDSWYLFEREDCVFFVINSSLLNSATTEEQRQKTWLTAAIEKNRAKRLFLFSHYPAFLHHADEPEHYDNIAEPSRSWLLNLLVEFQFEAVFSGHVHHFFCNALTCDQATEASPQGHAGCQLFCLPPTSFTRQDYAEMFRTVPAEEFGRDDRGKFSVAMVDVMTEGIRLRILPTEGIELSAGGQMPAARTASHTMTIPNLCVPLRHAWHESIDLPFNGPMEEFSRKRCRNDYTLLRLLQMQIRYVRVPLQDLLDPHIRKRMRVYQNMGIRFHVFCLGVPDQNTLGLLLSHSDLVQSLELVSSSLDNIVLDDNRFPDFVRALTSAFKPDASEAHKAAQIFPLTLSKAHSSAHNAVPGKTFAHSVSNGFMWDEHPTVMQALEQSDAGALVRSVTYQIPLENDCASLINAMQDAMANTDYSAIANIKFAPQNPAQSNFDDELICQRLLQAMDCARHADRVDLQLDTFMDVDRGYAPRHGLLDRRCNFRKAGRSLLQT